MKSESGCSQAVADVTQKNSIQQISLKSIPKKMRDFRGMVLAVCMAACSVLTGAAYTVSGTVSDDTGEPLMEAGVRLLAAKDRCTLIAS